MPNPTSIIVGRTGTFNVQEFSDAAGTLPVDPANVASVAWSAVQFGIWAALTPSADGASCVVALASTALVGIDIPIQAVVTMHDGSSATGTASFHTDPPPPPQVQKVVITQVA